MNKQELERKVEELIEKIESDRDSSVTEDGKTNEISKGIIDEWIDELNSIRNRIEEL